MAFSQTVKPKMAYYQIFIQKVLPQHSVTVLIASLAYWQSIKWREIYVDMLNLEENLKKIVMLNFFSP